MVDQKIITPNYDWFTYDIEIYAHDFIVIFKNKLTGERFAFHNDNEGVRDFIVDTSIHCGFNTKGYDQYLIKAICEGFSPEELKKVNDWLIETDGQGWECPYLRGVFYRFNNVDIRDDVQKGLSLKAIEGHLGMSIEECSVPFDIDRPLTHEELQEVIKYCIHDVDAAEQLTDVRFDYLKTKRNLGNRASVDELKALSATNAKLTAMMLKAVRKEWNDGRDYVYPENLDKSVIPKPVLDFFDTIHDKSIPDEVLFKTYLDIEIGGMLCRFAWGGVHGSLTCYHEEATEKRVIQNRDVSSLYPSLIELYNYLSRNVPDPQIFYDIRKDRLTAKHTGNTQLKNDLKLPLNTVSGAQENRYNDLYDPLPTRSMRISGQLFLTVLAIRLLKACKTIKLLNLNTDGLMYSVDKSELHIVDKIASDWEKETRFELETDDIQKVWIKDVNNLLFIKTSGEVKKVGGYLNYGISIKGAWSINNNMIIVKKAVADYFVKGTPVEKTILECDNLFEFQIIAKAGRKYRQVYHVVDGDKNPVQKVNRVYSTSDKRYGKLYKVHAETNSTAKIESLPEHCIIDNDNHLTIEDIDKTFYIEMAQKRINDFLGIKPEKPKLKKGEKQMAKKTETHIDTTTMNVWQKLLKVRAEFLAKGVKKSGFNLHAEFTYFELKDIVPVAQELFEKYNCMFLTTFPDGKAVGKFINLDHTDESITVEFNTRSISEPAKFRMNEVQGLGAEITYMRRYLYFLILDIVTADDIDAGSGGEVEDIETPSLAPVKKAPVSTEKRKEIKQDLTDVDGNADELQINALKSALKELRETDPSQEEFIQEIVLKTNSLTVISKSACEQLILKIGELIASYKTEG